MSHDPSRLAHPDSAVHSGPAGFGVAPWSGGVHRAIEAAARARPHAPAAVFARGELSYAALSGQASRLARVLAARGVAADARVAVMMERGPELAVALLATLKAGAAYVPVDVGLPEERIRLLLADSGACLVLADAASAHRVPSAVSVPVIPVDLACERLAAEDATELAADAHPDALAYVIYTSGSTGRPKGVGITHRALEVHATTVAGLFGLAPGDRVAQVASLGFDISIEEMVPTWAAGGAVVFRPAHLPADGPAFNGWLAENAVSVLDLPTAFWHAWTGELARAGGAPPASLRLVVVGGERALPHVWEQWAALAGPDVTWMNTYGPTETTVAVTAHPRRGGEPRAGGDIPIGLPLDEVRAYVLDDALLPVPSGAEGELVVGGPRVARGYLGLPASTAAAFVPDPFAGVRGARMYRTGDRVRWPAGGELEFRGRMDGQVKVGGFRVEPAETEAVLAEHDSVSAAAVVAREGAAGHRHLVGYWVPAPGTAPAGADLRAFLAGRLPAYMVPATLVRLDALPLSPNGKVDRRALPDPVEADADWLPPRTHTQQVLAGVWAEVLGAARVGEADDFVALGGHSLPAMQVASRVRQLFGVELSVRALFDAPRLDAFAAAVDAARLGGGAPARPPLEPADRSAPLPLSFAQQRLWFLYRLEPGSPFYNIPAAVRIRGALDAAALRGALTEVCRRHEALRTIYTALPHGAVQHVLSPSEFALSLHDLAAEGPEHARAGAERLAREEAARPFDLTRETPLRALLARVGEDEHLLVLNLHHIAGDGWSIGVLFRELATAYAALARGARPELCALPVQYADYALWQRAWLTDEVLQHQLAYWRGALEGAPEVLALPADRPRPARQSYRGAVHSFSFGGELSERLRALARGEGATPFMVLLAAFAVVLHRMSGERDLVIGSPVAGRVRPELERLIGFFVNALALRVRIAGDPSFSELLAQVRETALEAYHHQDLPFERLVEELAPERTLSHSPLYQVSFALQTQPMAPVNLPGATLALEWLDSGTAKSDLHLEVVDQGGALAASLEYATDLWDEASAVRIAERLVVLAEAATREPSERVSRLAVLTEGERRLEVEGWNPPGAPLPDDLCVHHLVEAQADLHPQATAVIDGDDEIAFAQLERRANRVAHRLIRAGVGVEDRVALFLDRGAQVVQAALGVMKAGAAYVPVDPAYPADRVAFMLADARVTAIVTSAALAGSLPGRPEPVVLVDGGGAAGDDRRPAVPVRAGNAAYVVYTSGSTGRPKGVVVPHRGVCNVARAQRGVLPAGPGDRVLQFASPSFDAWAWELVLSLGQGAALVIPSASLRAAGAPLAVVLARHRVTHAVMTPSVLALLPADDLPALRVLAVAAEPCPPGLAERWGDGRRFLNLYGPTEASIWVTWAVLRGGETPPPIGVPIPNLCAYVLDAAMGPMPVGGPGELFVGGAGVARGYHGRPGLTAERFVPDPFSTLPGARLYRTGDRVRRLGDGQLVFLGRTDGQVKLRGFRIETGEVEAVLATHPSVREAVVQLRAHGRDEPRLVAYVVPRAGEAQGGDGRVEQWRELFDDVYAGARPDDVQFDISGWFSSYTGEPIPAAEMREWAERTGDRVRALGPRRVMEIGVGSGLVLFRVAPVVEEYVGTDLSATAVETLRRIVDERAGSLPPVRLEHREADDFHGVPPRAFDTVILNSVVQYFPSADYLARVLEGAAEAVGDGGVVFVGDVRSLPTLQAFHAGIELHQAGGAAAAAELLAAARRRTADEEELVVDPAFFHALRARVPRIAHAEIRLKRGVHHNELTRHRYDVVLHVGGPVTPARPARAADWDGRIDAGALGDWLRAAAGEVSTVSGIPDARVQGELAALRLLSADPQATADDARRAMSQAPGVDPEEVWTLAESLGMEAELRPSPGRPGCFDALFRPAGTRARTPLAWPAEPAPPAPERLANEPRRGVQTAGLVPRLRGFARGWLPDYMVPSAWVVLDEVPLTPNGKTDRAALPAPAAGGADRAGYVAPRTETEAAIAEIWSELLRVDRVGVDDGFFDAGGHSLLATVLVSRIRERFTVDMPLHRVFQTPTVAGLAAAVDEAGQRALDDLIAELDEMSDDEARALLALEAEGLVG